jgi:hypothetical protein
MDVMNRVKLIVVLCAMALTVGCTQNKSTTKSASAKSKSSKTQVATTRPSSSGYASGKPTTAPSATANINPLAGYWQLAIPRLHVKDASITAKDPSHVWIEAGKNLSGEYVIQGNYLLIITRDERMRTLAWKINSNDSLTLVRSPDFGAGRSYMGVTLFRAPDDSATSADMAEMWSE